METVSLEPSVKLCAAARSITWGFDWLWSNTWKTTPRLMRVFCAVIIRQWPIIWRHLKCLIWAAGRRRSRFKQLLTVLASMYSPSAMANGWSTAAVRKPGPGRVCIWKTVMATIMRMLFVFSDPANRDVTDTVESRMSFWKVRCSKVQENKFEKEGLFLIKSSHYDLYRPNKLIWLLLNITLNSFYEGWVVYSFCLNLSFVSEVLYVYTL